MLDPVSISVSLIFIFFYSFSCRVKNREKTRLLDTLSQPAQILNSESEISEPANKQQVNKRRKSSNAHTLGTSMEERKLRTMKFVLEENKQESLRWRLRLMVHLLSYLNKGSS